MNLWNWKTKMVTKKRNQGTKKEPFIPMSERMNKILKDGYLIVFFLLLIYLFQLQFAYVTENSTSGILCSLQWCKATVHTTE